MTVDSSQKVLLMGRSKDLSVCQSRTKAGKPCTNFVNLYVESMTYVNIFVLLVYACVKH